MGNLLFTCDVECHDLNRPEHWLLGKVGKRYWLEIAARELASRKIEGTFFVDFVGCEKWEHSFMKALEMLGENQQRIELHIHPGNAISSSSSRLSDMDYDEQAKLFVIAITNYQRYLGISPKFFRAGAYGINKATLRLLKHYNLADSSFYIGKPQVKVSLDDYLELGVGSYPVTVSYFKHLNKYVKHDLNIMLKTVLKKQLLGNNIMAFMHSFSFNRFQGRQILDQANRLAVERFKAILELIDNGKTVPVSIEQFKDYEFITKISIKDMLQNALYIFLKNHYLID
jgi:hypothetical protein